MDEPMEQKTKEHYVCLGGCRGVSETPGTCQSEGCKNHGYGLTPCTCEDGEHNNFEEEK